MAGFVGIEWAPGQYHYPLARRTGEMLPPSAGTHAVSRSVHYGLCLAFEGIRFFVRPDGDRLSAVFVNLDANLGRFRRGIAYNLSDDQAPLVPSVDALRELVLAYLRDPALRPFVSQMARAEAQGYLRPFTVDDDQSIGVTFPANPVIRIVGARYESYLGEPFSGVAVPWLVRAVAANGTGCLKLGINYLLSVKAVQAARRVRSDAGSALFLDDRPTAPLMEREVSEWDSSCCLVGLRDGSVVKIPESPLILPSVTIQGIAALLRRAGVDVQERRLLYGELVERARAGEVVTVASVGTAGILNRCASLTLVDGEGAELAEVRADPDHPVYAALGDARRDYWAVYRGAVEPPDGMVPASFDLGPADG